MVGWLDCWIVGLLGFLDWLRLESLCSSQFEVTFVSTLCLADEGSVSVILGGGNLVKPRERFARQRGIRRCMD